MINEQGQLEPITNKYLLFVKDYWREIIIALVVLIFAIILIKNLPIWK